MNDPSNAGPWSFVEVENLLIGGNGQKLVRWTGTDLLGLGLPAPAAAPGVVIQAGGNISPVTGYEWAFSWKSSGNSPALNGPSLNPVPSDFSIAASPSSQSISQDNTASYKVTITPTGGFTGTVSFAVSGVPRGMTASFNPTMVTTSGSTRLNLKARNAQTGTFQLTITGTGGGRTHSTTVTLIVKM